MNAIIKLNVTHKKKHDTYKCSVILKSSPQIHVIMAQDRNHKFIYIYIYIYRLAFSKCIRYFMFPPIFEKHWAYELLEPFVVLLVYHHHQHLLFLLLVLGVVC